MEIRNSDLNDLPLIFKFYRIASAYMKSKNQVAWPEFERDLIIREIEEHRQWKILINDEIACVWAITMSDPLIWGDQDLDPAVYIHRIATNPDFRGRNLVGHIVTWADHYCDQKELKYVRLDTVGMNNGLIGHYQKWGFDFLGARELENTDGLPEHYKQGPVCLFERKVS